MSKAQEKNRTIQFDDRDHYEKSVISKKRSDEIISVHSMNSDGSVVEISAKNCYMGDMVLNNNLKAMKTRTKV